MRNPRTSRVMPQEFPRAAQGRRPARQRSVKTFAEAWPTAPRLIHVAHGGDGRLSDDLDVERAPRDACGVFGVWVPPSAAATMEVSKLAYYGLYALQHRGQESAGIAVSDGARIV